MVTRLARRLACGTALLVLAGQGIAQTAVAPAATVPATAPVSAQTASAAATEPVQSPVVGTDLALALRAATQADPALMRALADRDAARENISLTRARVLPQVSANASASQLDQVTRQGRTETVYNGPSRVGSLQLRQAIYRPRDWTGLEIGDRQAEYGELKLVSAQAELWARTASAWIDVVAAQSMREAYARTLSAVAQSAAQEQRRFAQGEGTRDAAAESQAQLALARARHSEAEADLLGKIEALDLITRAGVRDFGALRLPLPDRLGLLPESEATLIARITDTNPDLAAARVATAINALRLRQAAADHRPTVDLVASANIANSDTTPTLGTRYHNTLLGLQLQIPLFTGGSLSAAERQAAATLASASADSEAFVQRARTQFARDWAAQIGLHQRALAALTLVQSGQETRRASQFAIRAGVRTWADLGSAELLVSQRESDLINLTSTLLKTQVRLLSLLPVSDPAWEAYTRDLDLLARADAAGGK